MEHKKELAKIALATLILAASSPVNASIDQGFDAHGTYLAAGCAAHGCGGGSTSPSSAKEGNVTADNTDQMVNKSMVTTPSVIMTDSQLLGQLNPQGKGIFMSLDPEGKALAIQLASQDTYKDKNLAVKEAQRRMNERRSSQMMR